MPMPEKAAFDFDISLSPEVLQELRARKVKLGYSPRKDVVAQGAASIAQIEDALMLPFTVAIRPLDLVEGLFYVGSAGDREEFLSRMSEEGVRRQTFMHWPRKEQAWGFEGIAAGELVHAICRLWLLTGWPDPVPWVDARVAELKKNRKRMLTCHDLQALWWKAENRAFKGRAHVLLHGVEPCEPSVAVLRDGRLAVRATNVFGRVREFIGPANLMKGVKLEGRLLDAGIGAEDQQRIADLLRPWTGAPDWGVVRDFKAMKAMKAMECKAMEGKL